MTTRLALLAMLAAAALACERAPKEEQPRLPTLHCLSSETLFIEASQSGTFARCTAPSFDRDGKKRTLYGRCSSGDTGEHYVFRIDTPAGEPALHATKVGGGSDAGIEDTSASD